MPQITDTAPTAEAAAPKGPAVSFINDPPAKPKPAPKTPAKPKAKPATKKAPKVETKKPGDFNWSDKRVKIVKALRALNATNGMVARDAATVAKKAGLTEADVKHYCYKDNDLVTAGFVSIAKLEGTIGIQYYVTRKGQTVSL